MCSHSILQVPCPLTVPPPFQFHDWFTSRVLTFACMLDGKDPDKSSIVSNVPGRGTGTWEASNEWFNGKGGDIILFEET